MIKLIKKLTNWYFTKQSLPYWAIFLMDCLICYLSGIFVFWLYYHGAVTLGNILLLSKTILMYMCFNIIGFRLFHTYSGIIRYSSFVDLKRVAYAMTLSLAIAEVMHYIVYGWNLEFIRLEGRQVAAMYVVATLVMWAARVFIKSIYDTAFSNDGAAKAMIYGVRDGGVALAKNIRNEKPSRYLLKGFITHDSSLKARMLMGEKVYQADDTLPEILKDLGISTLLVSPMQNERFRKDTYLQDMLINAGITIYMATGGAKWTPDDKNAVEQLKEVAIEDLLPRDEIQVDMESVGNMLNGHRILITGSAGSIGSEMVRQICVYQPSELMLIDQAETPMHDIRLMMAHQYSKIPAHTVVTSITNQKSMEKIFSEFKPEYVFHAAAYKHVPMMEDNPYEAVHNNINGTKIIADLSVKYGVKKFVMISTDKAVNPTNVMGCSKRICEIYCQSLNASSLNQSEDGKIITEFVTTRFGNVLGSNGSVIPLFKRQIQSGGPVTVTDPNIIRFFMLIPEACKLVLEAGTKGRGGQIFVFDMGNPVKIADLARRMIQLSGAKNVEIAYTGLRAGEKLYEEVLSNDENTLPSFNKKIRIAKVREYDYNDVNRDIENLCEISRDFDAMATVGKMKEIVPEYKSNNSIYEKLDK